MAVIYRHQWQGDKLAHALAKNGIPNSLAKGQGKHDLFADEDTVKIISVHSSKGLEFPFVAIPYLGSLPEPQKDESEETRLLYVAMTRAIDQLLLLYHEESIFTNYLRASINDVQRQLAEARAE